MKKFLFNTAILGIILCLMAITAEKIITSSLRKSQHYNLLPWNEIFSGNLRYDALINGSSRALAFYNPLILDSVLNMDFYNMGITGSVIERQIFKYNTYCRLNIPPKLIIQNIDFNTLNLRHGFEREQFFPYFSDQTFRKEISCWEPVNFLEKYLPAYRFKGSAILIAKWLTLNRTSLGPRMVFTKGYFGFEKKWDGTELRKQNEIDYKQDTTALRIFDQFLASVRKDSIKVIFVYAPLYIEATKKIRNIEGMYQMYDSIARKYNIPILDYTYAPISYDTVYFYNATHLNKRGAELFSAQLAHDIDSLMHENTLETLWRLKLKHPE